jgi:transcription initiation factor TFIIE subunit alpha
MQRELIREVVVNVVGKQVEEIADLLDSKKHVNEFIIAKKLDITINQTRNILYKLSDFGLVSSIRKKDKKKGWYTYFWKFENVKAMEFLKNLLDKKINQINAQINSRESKQFYVCERCKLEFSEENALFMDFTCDECGGVFILRDNTKILKELKKNLVRSERELKIVEVELAKEREKIEKKRAKELEKEKKEKDLLRKQKAAERKKLADKLKKENPPKKTDKKKAPKKIKKKKAPAKTKKKVAKKTVKKSVNKSVKKPAKNRLKRLNLRRNKDGV